MQLSSIACARHPMHTLLARPLTPGHSVCNLSPCFSLTASTMGLAVIGNEKVLTTVAEVKDQAEKIIRVGGVRL